MCGTIPIPFFPCRKRPFYHCNELKDKEKVFGVNCFPKLLNFESGGIWENSPTQPLHCPFFQNCALPSIRCHLPRWLPLKEREACFTTFPLTSSFLVWLVSSALQTGSRFQRTDSSQRAFLILAKALLVRAYFKVGLCMSWWLLLRDSTISGKVMCC